MVKLIRVSGFSGSGKTMLVTALVEKLTGQGVFVATVKHHGGHGHGNPLGEAGKKVTVRLDLVRTFKDVQFKIRYAEKTKFSIHGAGLYAKLSGKK